jgi:large subunit ribosomal protein L22
MDMESDKKDRLKRHQRKFRQKAARVDAAKSVGRYFRAAPDKVRIMADAIVGREVEAAEDILKMSLTKSSKLLLKVLHSAVSNAWRSSDSDVDKLVVGKIFVDRGPMLKRVHPVSHGMAKPILKRTCHITVIVNEAKGKIRK